MKSITFNEDISNVFSLFYMNLQIIQISSSQNFRTIPKSKSIYSGTGARLNI